MEQNTAEEDGVNYSVAGSPVSITCNHDTGQVSGSMLPQAWGDLHGAKHKGEAVIYAAKSTNQAETV
jgi:hypothetical protein